jgi:ATP-dependent Lhr-like helicase
LENGVEKARGAAPVRNTPIALLQRKNFAIWNSVFPQPSLNESEFSTTTSAVHDYLATRGASFFSDVVEGTKLLRSQVEEALGELVANGLVISDSFAGLRALLTPSSRKTQAASRRKHRQPVYEMSSAGRWSLLNRQAFLPLPAATGDVRGSSPTVREGAQFEAEAAEEIARILLKRYGVVFKRLLEREGIALPWRVLLRIYHRLEARGEIRGGRFVAGISGEQFALPEAVGMLRAIRRARGGSMDFGIRSPSQMTEDSATEPSVMVGLPSTEESLISVSAADPLNLVGIITPGGRITAFTSNRILYRNGEPVAVLEAGETRFLVELSRAMEWKAKAALMRKATPPPLRSYLRQRA